MQLKIPTKQAIIDSVRNWCSFSHLTDNAFNDFFASMNGFEFIYDCKNPETLSLYFGYTAGEGKPEIQVYLIPESKDTVAWDVSDLIITNAVQHPGNNGEISVGEASKRIQLWLDQKYTWIAEQTGLFFCISIPEEDFSIGENRVKAYFGLKKTELDGGIQTTFDIVLERLGTNKLYYDTVRLVPPFPPANNHYILAAAR